MNNKFTFLDYNSTTPVDRRVLEVMLPYFTDLYANTSSVHLFGLSVQEGLEEALESLVEVLGGKTSQYIFTSGATESINLAIKGLMQSERKHILAVSTEHKSVLDTCTFMESMGYHLTYLPVDSEGILDIELLSEAINDNTLLVCTMLANNETGVIHPIQEISQIAHQNGTYVLCDATQAIGKMSVCVEDLGVDLMAFSAHKFYGPKGIGGLYISDGVRKSMQECIHGGRQQNGLRSGTLNVPGIVGMCKAVELVTSGMNAEQERIKNLRDQLENGLLSIPDSFINGSKVNRLANTLNICFQGVNADQLIMKLGKIAVSNGSACSSTVSKPSHVLQAMGLSDADALSAIRFSLGKYTTDEEVFKSIELVKKAVNELRSRN